MTLRELYDRIGGDYADVTGRLPSERFIQKYVLKFLDDGSYDLLLRSFAEGNDEEAFRAAHTIKGMCQNLSFTCLGKSSDELTEALRNGRTPAADGLLEQVKADYQKTVEGIRSFQESL